MALLVGRGAVLLLWHCCVHHTSQASCPDTHTPSPAPLQIIDYIWRAKQPYNVSVAAEVAACAALTNQTYMKVGVRCGAAAAWHAGLGNL